jgi:hypothetical protein
VQNRQWTLLLVPQPAELMCCSRRLNKVACRAMTNDNHNNQQTNDNHNNQQTNDNNNNQQTNDNNNNHNKVAKTTLHRWRMRCRMQKKSHHSPMMQPAELSAANAVENPDIATLARTEGLGAALKLAKKTPACRVTFSRHKPYALILG